ncbi:hypothetical protein EXU30_13515 [Shewanella maritima]|uniref:STAS/SEC14 domain-containing protein n=1 Tax=Shewanella maritima TaxID=2520507 RepID=A0A411PJN7_9GAMM|nr:hypothetical protein [Shewanella maritima]QBF83600.1 hypothetical protein EXU30_13515 [Shewanella maritima]
MPEAAHGEFTIQVTGNLICTKMTGSYNEAGATAYTQAVMEQVKRLNGKPFGIVADNRGVLGGTPEAYAVLDEYNVWMEDNNMHAKAVVFNAKIMATILKNQSPSMQAENIQMFTDLNQANRWIENKLEQIKA